jgi:hypothetical protein
MKDRVSGLQNMVDYITHDGQICDNPAVRQFFGMQEAQALQAEIDNSRALEVLSMFKENSLSFKDKVARLAEEKGQLEGADEEYAAIVIQRLWAQRTIARLKRVQEQAAATRLANSATEIATLSVRLGNCRLQAKNSSNYFCVVRLGDEKHVSAQKKNSNIKDAMLRRVSGMNTFTSTAKAPASSGPSSPKATFANANSEEGAHSEYGIGSACAAAPTIDFNDKHDFRVQRIEDNLVLELMRCTGPAISRRSLHQAGLQATSSTLKMASLGMLGGDDVPSNASTGSTLVGRVVVPLSRLTQCHDPHSSSPLSFRLHRSFWVMPHHARHALYRNGSLAGPAYCADGTSHLGANGISLDQLTEAEVDLTKVGRIRIELDLAVAPWMLGATLAEVPRQLPWPCASAAASAAYAALPLYLAAVPSTTVTTASVGHHLAEEARRREEKEEPGGGFSLAALNSSWENVYFSIIRLIGWCSSPFDIFVFNRYRRIHWRPREDSADDEVWGSTKSQQSLLLPTLLWLLARPFSGFTDPFLQWAMIMTSFMCTLFYCCFYMRAWQVPPGLFGVLVCASLGAKERTDTPSHALVVITGGRHRGKEGVVVRRAQHQQRGGGGVGGGVGGEGKEERYVPLAVPKIAKDRVYQIDVLRGEGSMPKGAEGAAGGGDQQLSRRQLLQVAGKDMRQKFAWHTEVEYEEFTLSETIKSVKELLTDITGYLDTIHAALGRLELVLSWQDGAVTAAVLIGLGALSVALALLLACVSVAMLTFVGCFAGLCSCLYTGYQERYHPKRAIVMAQAERWFDFTRMSPMEVLCVHGAQMMHAAAAGDFTAFTTELQVGLVKICRDTLRPMLTFIPCFSYFCLLPLLLPPC